MKKIRLLVLVFIAMYHSSWAQWSVLMDDKKYNETEFFLYQRFTQKEWDASNFAKPEDMKWFLDARYGMFVHFGLNSYVNKDMSWPIVRNRKMPDRGQGAYPDQAWQVEWPSKFKLEKFNATEWVNIAQRSGMKYMTIVVKHHDGFHLWDTQFSDFKITNTPFGRDYLKELIDACHAAGLPVGLYYSQRDWYHPDYEPIDTSTVHSISDPPYYEALPGKRVTAGKKHKKYIDYQFKAIRELLTKYGKIDIFWFDAVSWGGMFTAEMWDSERLTRMIRELQPGIVINNRASLPGDFDTPEQRIGMYQERPWESAMTLNGSWGYDPEHKIKPVKNLVREMLTAAAGNGNVLISWGAKFDGAFDSPQMDSLLAIGHWLKQYGDYYYGTRGGPWMPTKEYGAVHKANKVYLYLFDQAMETIKLPILKHNRLRRFHRVGDDKALNWKEANNNYVFTDIKTTDPIVQIFELEFDSPIQETVGDRTYSIFDSPTYGKLIYEKKLNKVPRRRFTVDLKKISKVTGIGLYGNIENLIVEYSINNQDWEKLSVKQGLSQQELSLNSFMAGMQVPGKEIRYLRIYGKPNPEVNIKIFSQ